MTRFDTSGSGSDSPDPFEGVPDLDERLADWVDGMMSGRDRERFEAEMRVNPTLRKQVEEYEQSVATIRSALGAETHSTDLADRVMAGIEQQASQPVRPIRSMSPYLWATTCAAALLGVAVMINAWGPVSGPKRDAAVVSADAAGQPTERTQEGRLAAGSGQGVSGNPSPATGLADVSSDSSVHESPVVGEVATVPKGPLQEQPAPDAADKPGAQAVRTIDVGSEGRASARPGDNGEVRPGRSVRGGTTPSAPALRGRSPAGSAGAPSPAGSAGAPSEVQAKREKLKGARTTGQSPDNYGAGARSLKAPGAEAPRAEAPRAEAAGAEAVDEEAAELESGAYGGREGAARSPLPNYRYWYAREDVGAEVVPRITIKGMAVVGGALPVTGSEDFYLGVRQDRKATALQLFFQSQMAATALPLAARKQGQGVGPEPEATQATSSLGWFLIGPLPEPSAPKEGDGASREPATSSGGEQSGVEQPGINQAGGGRIVERMPLPGKQEADGGDYVERDWLVVGPRSEVRSLLKELRQYAVVAKLDWLSGEAKIASQPPAGVSAPAPTAPDASPNKQDPSVAIRKSGAGGRAARPVERAATKSSDKAVPDASPTTKPEPVLRVVVRFRARR
jgi:hypothetical protein